MELTKYTAYEIINKGISISPNLNRDEYYKQEFIKKEDIQKIIDYFIEKIKKQIKDNYNNGID